MCDVNTTPLIDVMLVLLVMLIVTLPIMTHAVKLDMPRPNPNQPENPIPPEVINVEIDFDGTIVWNGNIVSNISTLDSYFRQEASKDPQPEIHLRPDRRARYDVVANVMASAQRNNMIKMGFTNVAEFRD
ncbi:MAG: biopolymer transporter ExbD [Nevskiaceae bacterium]|jgi:biopolymer transport protein ExbD|nr:biopolymer transporter ExbD [Nevskiaceae bacterium]